MSGPEACPNCENVAWILHCKIPCYWFDCRVCGITYDSRSGRWVENPKKEGATT